MWLHPGHELYNKAEWEYNTSLYMLHQNDASCHLTTLCLILHEWNHHRRTFLLLLNISQPYPTESEHVSPPPEMRSIFLTFSTRRKRSRTCLTGSVSISYATEMFCAVQHSSNFWFVELQWHWQRLAFRAAPSHRYGLHSCPSPPPLWTLVVGILIPLSDSFESVH